MIKRIIILIQLLIVSFINGFSQPFDSLVISKNAIYFEIFGSAGYVYNISYDRIIIQQNRQNITIGLGVQYYKGDMSEDKLQTISPQINYLLGFNRHFFELGAGYYWDFYDSDMNSLIMRIGYRYQKKNGLFFKIGITPILTKSFPIFGEGYKILPWGGIGLGYAF